MRAQLADEELSRLRHATHARAFETFLNNALGSFLDSGDEAHLQEALELVTRLEGFLILGATSDVLYQVACVLARAGEAQRALDYVERAVDKGESIGVMAEDSDFASLVDEPRFVGLRE